MHTLVIGGGAAGMFAAIAAARRGDRVAVAERGRKPLKKLGVTGNGRGNLLNVGPLDFYGDADFARQVLEQMPAQEIRALWERLGVPLVPENEGRMYPACFLAAAAVDALLLEATRQGVEIHTAVQVNRLTQSGGRFQAEGTHTLYQPDTLRKSGKAKPGAALAQEAWKMTCDRVIVAAGGAASPMHGTDGSAYGLLTGFGHRLETPRPALCALVTETGPLQGLEGQRARAELCLTAGGQSWQSRGEVLFAADGVSGIAAMQLGRFAVEGANLSINLSPGVTGERMDAPKAMEWLKRRCLTRPGLTAGELLTGAAAPGLTGALLKRCGMNPADAAGRLEELARVICDFRLKVRGCRGFEAAQVTAGGALTGDFDPLTLESRLCPGLYAAGEILNVDGGCGGFNLMFAAASGWLAGKG